MSVAMRQPGERQRECSAVTGQDLVELTIQASERAMLDGLGPGSGLPALHSRRSGSGADNLEIEVGWQSGGGMTTKELLGYSGTEARASCARIANDIVLPGKRRDAIFLLLSGECCRESDCERIAAFAGTSDP